MRLGKICLEQKHIGHLVQIKISKSKCPVQKKVYFERGFMSSENLPVM